MRIAYTVRCVFIDEQVAHNWVEWLKEEHLRDVCEAGAERGEAVYLDQGSTVEAVGKAVVCEARYLFASRRAFETYVEQQAPRLRQEGLIRFPLSLGLTYSRTIGEVVGEYDR